jgi:hypothetical protein
MFFLLPRKTIATSGTVVTTPIVEIEVPTPIYQKTMMLYRGLSLQALPVGPLLAPVSK